MAWVPGKGSTTDQIARGAFSSWPAATPKYAKNDGAVRDFQDTMARMYLWLDATTYARFTAVSEDFDARTKGIAARLASQHGATNSGGFGYVEFLMQQASHPLQEKVDVVDTLADHFATYSFGQAPPTFTYEVALLNNRQDDQANNMFRLYRNILRATALASLRTEVHLQYNGMIVSGAMLSFNWSLNAADESYCPGAFSVLVRKITLLDDPENQYDDSVKLSGAAGLTDKVLADLLPKRLRGVAGTAAQLIPEQATPPPAAGPAPAPAAAAPTAAEQQRLTRQRATVLTAALAAAQTGDGAYVATNPPLAPVTVSRDELNAARDVAYQRVQAVSGTNPDLEAAFAAYKTSNSGAAPSGLSAGQQAAYNSLVTEHGITYAAVLANKGVQL